MSAVFFSSIDKKSTNNEDAYLLLPAVLSATLYRRKEGDKNIHGNWKDGKMEKHRARGSE
jgi:hypothetical protein